MRRIITRLLSFFRLRALTSAMAYADKWENRAARLDRRLGKLRRELTDIVSRLDSEMRVVEQLQAQHSTAIEALRSQLKIAEDTTIPTLVASHQLLLKHYDAEAAIEVRRLLASTGRQEDEV